MGKKVVECLPGVLGHLQKRLNDCRFVTLLTIFPQILLERTDVEPIACRGEKPHGFEVSPNEKLLYGVVDRSGCLQVCLFANGTQ